MALIACEYTVTEKVKLQRVDYYELESPHPITAATLYRYSPYGDPHRPSSCSGCRYAAFDLERVRIEGIDAPEAEQTCRDAAGKEYPCGEVATEALRARLDSDRVTCKGDTRDRYGRLIGVCFFADGIDLTGWVVRQGYALAYRTYSTAHVDAENEAGAEWLGIWAGECVPPWAWRRGERLPLASVSISLPHRASTFFDSAAHRTGPGFSEAPNLEPVE